MWAGPYYMYMYMLSVQKFTEKHLQKVEIPQKLSPMKVSGYTVVSPLIYLSI